MRKIILIATAIVVTSLSINAQEKPKDPAQRKARMEKQQNTAEQRAQRNVNQLNAEVNLTQEQQVKVKELAIVRIKKADEIRAKYKDQPESKEAAKKELDVVRKEFKTGVKAVLTAEQIQVLKEKKKANQAVKDAAKQNSEELIELAD